LGYFKGCRRFTFLLKSYNKGSEQQRDSSLTIFFLLSFSTFFIIVMSIQDNRETIVNTLTSRVIENAPLRELIRVYSEAVQAAIAQLSDDDVVRSIAAAGYTDILEAFELTVPEAPAEAEATPVEGVPA
jgi:hypothetical protein